MSYVSTSASSQCAMRIWTKMSLDWNHSQSVHVELLKRCHSGDQKTIFLVLTKGSLFWIHGNHRVDLQPQRTVWRMGSHLWQRRCTKNACSSWPHITLPRGKQRRSKQGLCSSPSPGRNRSKNFWGQQGDDPRCRTHHWKHCDQRLLRQLTPCKARNGQRSQRKQRVVAA